ncbi:MAG: hypothetical protein TH68_04970 [Candidatus Synechococcus spongiarum 142]|uniref:mRNA interferase n=1 Tax=Candidatus Synechococcus spongiarum 142 TaxID=1608213 RepID=A0A6N3XB67_9SYNE|nr:MAG: hypothetical protein TH68_04970 [Candidatus Synechococcus spongiarum 142]
MTYPHQYEIWVASLDGAEGSEMKKTRPVAVVSPDSMNQNLGTVVICSLASKVHRDWPSRLQIVCAGRTSEVAVDQIRTLNKERFVQCIDSLSDADSRHLRSIIRDLYAPEEG